MTRSNAHHLSIQNRRPTSGVLLQRRLLNDEAATLAGERKPDEPADKCGDYSKHRYVKTERCGVVDWGHANPKNARQLIAKIRSASDQLKMQHEVEQFPASEAIATHQQKSRALGLDVNEFQTEFSITRPLTEKQIFAVALGIFQHVSIGFEKQQAGLDTIKSPIGLGKSSFSAEDLPSNMISFYRAAKNLSPDDVLRICVCQQNVDESPEGTNASFAPAGGSWPSEFDEIVPEGPGVLWKIKDDKSLFLGVPTGKADSPPSGMPTKSIEGNVALQAKLIVNRPGDEYEEEADHVADKVMRMPKPEVQRCTCGKSSMGGECSECKKKKLHEGGESLQRVASSPVGGIAAPPIVDRVLNSSGSPLPTSTRSFMESRFGQDFSHVRVHTDQQAVESAAAVQARAYTVGNNIVFGRGEGPSTDSRLLAHELTHVLQQSGSSKALASTIALQRTPLASDEQQATAILESFLNEQGVAYKKEVTFRVEVDGQWVEGRADFFIETSDGWKPVEMKGKATSKWTPAQEKYIPALQSGARFETIGTGKFSQKIAGSGGGHVLDVHSVASGKLNFQKEFSTTYIRRPKGDASKGEKVTVVKDKDGNKLRETRVPERTTGTSSNVPSTKVEVKEPHVKITEPKVHVKEPHVKLRGKGVIVAVIVGGITYLVTRDAYAAGQSINPLAETTDAVVKGHGAGGFAWGVVKDIWYLTPAGMVHATGQLAWDLNEAMMAASHFPVPEGWVDQMVAEGRNPFCALCHDPRGPLARERERANMYFDMSKFENVAGFSNTRFVEGKGDEELLRNSLKGQ